MPLPQGLPGLVGRLGATAPAAAIGEEDVDRADVPLDPLNKVLHRGLVGEVPLDAEAADLLAD